MEQTNPLGRYRLTRRISGRRGVTPIRSKQKKSIPKTRGHKLEKKPYVPLRKHTSSHHEQERKVSYQDKHSEDSERGGNQDSHLEGKRDHTQEHSQTEQFRDQENPNESVHPGIVQALPDLPESTASVQTADKTEIEAEEIPL
jgi:hypothetical protein